MAIYTRRVQTVLTDEQYRTLKHLSEKEDRPVSELVREAVKKVYLRKEALSRRRAALESLLSLEAPVTDWEEMEEEIIKGALDE